MNTVNFVSNPPKEETELFVLPLIEGGLVDKNISQRDLPLYEAITFNIQREKFFGREGETLFLTLNGSSNVHKVLVLGLGPAEKLTSIKIQGAGGLLATKMISHNCFSADIYTPHLEESSIPNMAFGFLLKDWKFDKYKKSAVKKRGKTIRFICQNPEIQKKEFEYFDAIFQGVALAKELTSEPANILYPETYADRCLKLREHGIIVDVLNQDQLKKIGAHALLAVGKGSQNPPYMVVMNWKGSQKEEAPIALIGKGVCYDAGGINLKNSYLVEMNMDKAASGTIVGVMQALAKINYPFNVMGVIGLAENMPDGAALKPSDVIDTLSGKRVEIIDTDNEGRLILADCLSYAQQFSPRVMIDLGTLTLETFGALADVYGGLFSEDEKLKKSLIEAGEKSGEELWPLPMGPAFAKYIQSSVADIKNSGIQGFGESSSTAEFLKCFVNEGVSWAHLDIAGMAWTKEDQPLCQPGVTGYGVRLLMEWLRSLENRM
jgi:leucyl aminopeptidase